MSDENRCFELSFDMLDHVNGGINEAGKQLMLAGIAKRKSAGQTLEECIESLDNIPEAALARMQTNRSELEEFMRSNW